MREGGRNACACISSSCCLRPVRQSIGFPIVNRSGSEVPVRSCRALISGYVGTSNLPSGPRVPGGCAAFRSATEKSKSTGTTYINMVDNSPAVILGAISDDFFALSLAKSASACNARSASSRARLLNSSFDIARQSYSAQLHSEPLPSHSNYNGVIAQSVRFSCWLRAWPSLQHPVKP